MFKIIVAYILGILIEVNLHTDQFTLFAILILSFAGYLFYSIYKGQIKDTRFFIKDILHFSLILSVFFVSVLYTKSELKTVSYKQIPDSTYQIEGKVISVKQQNSSKELLISVDKIVNLTDNSLLTNAPEHISVQVSLLNTALLFDRLNIIGEIEFKNWQTYYEKEPLFYSYEYMKLSDNSFYTVSHPKHIEIKNRELENHETLLIKFHELSNNLKSKIPEHMNEPYAAIAQGISLGEQDNLQKDIKDIFRESGLIHILVLSGANIVFVISLIWYFLKRLKSKLVKVVAIIIFSWVFIFTTGLAAPSARAGFMATFNILGEYFSKNISSLQSLLLSLFILTIINPLSLIYSSSLHLSFLACFGLYVIAPVIENNVKKTLGQKQNFLIFLLATFIAIFITVTPYLIALVGSSSLFGTLLTFVAEPFIMLSTILSFLIIFLSFFNFYLADFFGVLNTIVTKIILLLAEFGAYNLPQVAFYISEVTLVGYYFVLFTLTLKFKDSINKEDMVGRNQEWYTLRK